nr:hypothetical protein [Tanacetum cinerariifolium]
MISDLKFSRLSSYIGIAPLPVSCSLQALSNLHYLFSGFMDYFWSCKLNISNFLPANRDEMCRFGKAIDNDPDYVMSA